MLQRLNPAMKFDAATVEERADYIFQFSLAAMRAMKSKTAVKKGKP